MADARPPIRKGNYLLHLHLEQSCSISTLRGQACALPAGYYLYIGSAFGSGGLRARLARHLRHEKKMHWHIDYLLVRAKVVAAWEIELAESREHEIARFLSVQKQFFCAIPRFGASDCSCETHLFRLPRRFTLPKMNNLLSPVLNSAGRFSEFKGEEGG
jgi:Uri superfamily endonuclease